MEIGRMAIIAATIKLQSGFLKTAKEVFSQAIGSPTHAASFTDVKSTCPKHAATT